MEKKYSHKEEYEETEYDKGKLESFDRIGHFEGGSQNPANVAAAKERCRTCIRRGKRFWKKCSWSKRIRYKYVEEGFKNKAKNTWGITTAGTPSGNDAEPPPQPVEPKAKAAAKQPRTKTAF